MNFKSFVFEIGLFAQNPNKKISSVKCKLRNRMARIGVNGLSKREMTHDGHANPR